MKILILISLLILFISCQKYEVMGLWEYELHNSTNHDLIFKNSSFPIVEISNKKLTFPFSSSESFHYNYQIQFDDLNIENEKYNLGFYSKDSFNIKKNGNLISFRKIELNSNDILHIKIKSIYEGDTTNLFISNNIIRINNNLNKKLYFNGILRDKNYFAYSNYLFNQIDKTLLNQTYDDGGSHSMEYLINIKTNSTKEYKLRVYYVPGIEEIPQSIKVFVENLRYYGYLYSRGLL